MTDYFNTEQHIPYKRLCELFQDVFNLTLSEGTIYNLLKNLLDNAGSLYREIRRRIETSPAVGADETGNCINGKLHWNRSFQTPRLTYIFSDESKGKAIHKRKRKPWNLIDRKSIMEKFEKLLFCSIKHLKQEVQNLQKALIKHRDNVFRFLFNPKIPYDC